jgi:hypothetical protein
MKRYLYDLEFIVKADRYPRHPQFSHLHILKIAVLFTNASTKFLECEYLSLLGSLQDGHLVKSGSTLKRMRVLFMPRK